MNPGEIAGNGIDDDGNGYIDDVYGIDPAGADGPRPVPATPIPWTAYGHGTHCAGTIGAVGNNARGVVGRQLERQDHGAEVLRRCRRQRL